MGIFTNFLAVYAVCSSLALRTYASKTPSLKVDLEYAVYQGFQDNSTDLNVWKGIRFAAPPIGSLRWKIPQTPLVNRTVIQATNFGPNCPQAYPAVPNARFIPGDEDCLFLNVYAPPFNGAKKLPVLVWIHGGGYGFGDGRQDMSTLINANGKKFVVVSIQYRLGAFGFLSSSEVKANGALNAGLLDMKFALEWIQKYIALFGGDAKKVTISGESAGAGAVMLLGIAKGGNFGTSLFRSGIAASPYLPPQYNYDGAIPVQRFNALVSAVGCSTSGDALGCLRGKDSMALQQANSDITISGTYATWAYLPVTDGDFITALPSTALNTQKVNGKDILVGNNANEGALFVPPILSTLDDLKAWLHLEFPTATDADVDQILEAYPSSDAPVDPMAPKFATDGLGSATAVNISQVATGQQQRANNIYAEATFVCPSYWLSNAYSTRSSSSYHYQYSVPFASHADDVTAYCGPSAPNQSPSFSLAFRQIWGNFITQSSPRISSDAAVNTWPQWERGTGQKMLNLNETGGVPYQKATQFGAPVTQFQDPGLTNDFAVVNAWNWEGRRGERCEFWRTMGSKFSI
ncbi:alpha/beta-hydrolase [Amniculicola lignicola CBS 123094]|uniref:Carboxylic ester hydrolase n=1 Tax=Amniculicola lignicola CBS 123094 TaxID=1392246 RepID=A0A6A5WZQ8_9PLEO|nr:alpha/beta-hydrolase [Amniculicola lignicola CBS 123094]